MVTGSGGQIGTVLINALRAHYGMNNVVSSDLMEQETEGPFEVLDVTDADRLLEVIRKHDVTEIYHLAALLSSQGEKNIDLTWSINFEAYRKILAVARQEEIKKIFFPSTIGVYGPSTPRIDTPQFSSFQPSTVYGISKMTAELWNEYYRNRYGMDIRSLRFPGVISYEVIPEGGTTDYSVEMFFAIARKGHYTSYLKPDSRLPMIYMPDVIKATTLLMQAHPEDISTSMGYNLSGFSLTPRELFEEIRKKYPDASIDYEPDARQKIADSWSETIDDSLARKDWGWLPDYDLQAMSEDMLKNVS